MRSALVVSGLGGLCLLSGPGATGGRVRAQIADQAGAQGAAQLQATTARQGHPAPIPQASQVQASQVQVPQVQASQVSAKGTSTGLPVPRFASFKSDKVHLRNGPGTEHAIQWVYNRAGLPVEILAESEAWRRIRDAEGTTGWVLATLLSGRRTALVEPWSLKPDTAKPLVPLKTEPSETASGAAQIEAGVIASVRGCDGRWCAVAILDFRGFIEQRRLWGVYKGETVK